MLWQLTKITISFLFFVATGFAASLSHDSAVLPPDKMQTLLNSKRNGQKSGQRSGLSEESRVRFVQLGQSAVLPFVLEPTKLGLDSIFEVVSTNKNQLKSILLRSDILVSKEWENRIFRHPGGFFIQNRLGSQQVSIFFEGFSETEIRAIFIKYQSQYQVNFSGNQSSRMPASSSEVARGSGEVLSSNQEKTQHSAVVESFERCGKAAADGFWDPLVSAGKAAELGVRNPSLLWSNTLRDWARFKEAIRKLELSTPIVKLKELWALPTSEQSKLLCNMLGGGGFAGASGKVAGTVSSKLSRGAAEKASVEAANVSETAVVNKSVGPVETAIHIGRIRSAFPKIGQKIDKNHNELMSWSQKTFLSFEEKLDRKRRERFKTLDPKIQETMKSVWEKMNDQKAFAQYIRNLSEDSVVEMVKRGSVDDFLKLKKGEFSRSAILKVLVNRFKQEGNDQFSILVDKRKIPVGDPNSKSRSSRKVDDNEGFREAVKQGPFWDRAFEGKAHGMDTHFVQINYVSDVIAKHTNGNPRLFWDFLGSKKGIGYWEELFDARDYLTLATPEVTRKVLAKVLPLK